MNLVKTELPPAPSTEASSRPAQERPTGTTLRARKKRRWTSGAIFLAILAATAYAVFRGSVASVRIVSPQTTTVAETVATAGVVEGRTEVSVGADAQGTIVQLLVHENDRVKKGQLLATIQNRVAQGNQQQAAAAVARARAQLEQAQMGATSEEIRAADAQLSGAVEGVAKARSGVQRASVAVRQAESAIDDARLGEKRAEAHVAQARSRQELAAKSFERIRRLVSEGALAGARLDEARTNLDVANAALADAGEALSSAKNGTANARMGRESALLASASAQTDLRTAAAEVVRARAQRDNLRNLPRRENIEVARAALREAQAAYLASKDLLQNTEVRAPFDGTVTEIVAERGASVGAMGVLRLVETGRLQAKAEIDESKLSELRTGQRVVLFATSDPDHPVEARVAEVSSHVDSLSGTVQVTATPVEPARLRAGQTVDMNIVVNPKASRLLVPTSAVRRKGDVSVLFVAEGGHARMREVRTGQSSGDKISVLQGLDAKDLVIADAGRLEDGARIRVQR